MENNRNFEEKELYEMAQKKVKKIKDFYIHLFIYLIAVALYIAKKYFNAPLNFFPFSFMNLFVMGIWTIVITFEIFNLFISQVLFGKKWEEKKIQEFINKEKDTKTWE